MTTQDGTSYRFGYVRDASLQVPYLGDDAGEPCRDKFPSGGAEPSASSFCYAPWRWMLDQEIDPKGNVTDYVYTREGHAYCRTTSTTLCQPGFFGGDGSAYRMSYDRGGYLAEVRYGHNVNVSGSAPTARVRFVTAARAEGVEGSGTDVPQEMLCEPPYSSCANVSPSLYVTRRLQQIVAEVYDTAGAAWDPVSRLELGHKWINVNQATWDGSSSTITIGTGLWLDTIRQVGMAGSGPDIAMPPTDFDAVLLDNRPEQETSWPFPRLAAVSNGLGGRTEFTYGQQTPCALNDISQDCYRTGSSGDYTYYNKWLVLQAVDKDLVGGSPDMPTTYEYVGAPAWADPVNYLLTDTLQGPECDPPTFGTCTVLKKDKTEWRGYPTVRTLKGGGTDPAGYSATSATFFRGLYEELKADGTPQHTQISDFEGNSYNDLRALAGRTLQEQTWRMTTYSATPAQRVYEEAAATRNEYTATATGDGPGIHNPRRIDQTRQVARQKVSSGWRYAEAKTDYNADGLPVKVNDYGERGNGSDNTCTATTFAKNTSGGAWMISYPASEERRAGDDCTAGTFMGRTVTLYDGATSEASNTPTVGNATEIRTYTSGSDYTSVKSTYDGYGRTLTATDPLGKTTNTSYSPAAGWPTGGVIVTNPLGHTVTTWTSPQYGQTVGIRDATNHDMNIDYDGLGRTITLWTPAQPKTGATAAATVTYTIPVRQLQRPHDVDQRNDEPRGVRAATLAAGTRRNGIAWSVDRQSPGMVRRRLRPVQAVGRRLVGCAAAHAGSRPGGAIGQSVSRGRVPRRRRQLVDRSPSSSSGGQIWRVGFAGIRHRALERRTAPRWLPHRTHRQ